MKNINSAVATTPKGIYFDMDGTIADLEGVENWLPRLRAYDAAPYAEAEPLVDMDRFAELLHKLEAKGIRVGIITWGSMVSNPEYDAASRAAKISWCVKHGIMDAMHEFHFTPYGTDKHSLADVKDSVLVDDNDSVRDAWTGNCTIKAGKGIDIIAKIEKMFGLC